MQTSKKFLGALVALAAMSAVATTASAQTCTFVTGPDVIVGELTGPQNYTINSGLDAVAIGTTSCNVGNQVLNWFANTVNHPVIGGAVYKYKVENGYGKFEQLGQSWLKHAFAALQGTNCCTNCTPGWASAAPTRTPPRATDRSPASVPSTRSTRTWARTSRPTRFRAAATTGVCR
jgi:hypothetical protein